MKVLLIFPPAASPVSPYLSVPILAGQLKNAGYDVSCLDLSVEFFHYILNSAFLSKSYLKAKNRLLEIEKRLLGKSFVDKEYSQYSKEEKQLCLEKYVIENILNDEKENSLIIQNIDNYILQYKNPSTFYNIVEMEKIVEKIHKAFKIAMLPYIPAKASFNSYANRLYENTYDEIKIQTEDTEKNIFYEFFMQKIKEHNIDEYDCICVSCPNIGQIMPTFTLTKILKNNSKANVIVGGNVISRIYDELKNIDDAFNYYYDYVLTGCGETSIVQIVDYLAGKNINLSDIKGLIYRNNGKIESNEFDLSYNINNSANLSLKGLDLNKYFTADIIMPVQSSKGCYWGKCAFCGLHYPPKIYSVKSPSKMVDEIEELNKKYNIKYFEFIDEAIHPTYLSELADEIIKRNLKIKYVCCARIEKNFYTQDLCEKAYKSGLRLVQLGYETDSKRIYEKLNKGIDYENRMDAVKTLADSGIWTYLYAIIGYPTETKEEIYNTLSLIDKYSDIVDTLYIHDFWLDKRSPVLKNYKDFGITKIKENSLNSFNQSLSYESNDEMTNKEINNLNFLYNEKKSIGKYSLFSPDEYFFLYVLHHGKEKMKKIMNA